MEKELSSVTLDPYLETADVDRDNNYWPPRLEPNRFRLFKEKRLIKREDPMQRAKRAQKRR